MKTIISIEELAKLIMAYCLSIYLGYGWWVFLVWIISPDISMIAYLINSKIGAWVYNLFHHQAIAVIIGILGIYLMSPQLQFIGLILFGHSAMDRALGYGLKYEDDFKHTHLGWIGKYRKQPI